MVKKVASMSSGPSERLRLAAPPSGWFCGRLKDSWIGACRWWLVGVVAWFRFETPSHAPLGSRRRRRSCSCRRERRQSSRRSGPGSRASTAGGRSFARGQPWRRSARQSHPAGLGARCRKQRRHGRAGKSRAGRSAKKGEGASWGGSAGICCGCAGRRGLLWVLWTPWPGGWWCWCWVWLFLWWLLAGRGAGPWTATEWPTNARGCFGPALEAQRRAHGMQLGWIHRYPICIHMYPVHAPPAHHVPCRYLDNHQGRSPARPPAPHALGHMHRSWHCPSPTTIPSCVCNYAHACFATYAPRTRRGQPFSQRRSLQAARRLARLPPALLVRVCSAIRRQVKALLRRPTRQNRPTSP